MFSLILLFRFLRFWVFRLEIVVWSYEDFEVMEKVGLKYRFVYILDGKDIRNCKMCELMGVWIGIWIVWLYYMCEVCGVFLCRS